MQGPVDSQPSGESDELELPVSRMGDIEPLEEGERWLVEGFLSRESITVLAAAPKTGKTWVSLALAVGVASGTAALGRYPASTRGPVLVFPAEDDPRAVRERVAGLCKGAGLDLSELELDIITAEQVLLDNPEDRRRLERVLEARRPRLVVLDPLVRLHSGAESYVGHVAELFGYLRTLQRRYGLAVLVTHHLAKNRGRSSQPGSAMRGSGEIHAAYDHGAALERMRDGRVALTLEHRVAQSPDPVAFQLLVDVDDGVRFRFTEIEEEEPDQELPKREVTPHRRPTQGLRERVIEALSSSTQPLSQARMREGLKVRNESLTEVLRGLQSDGVAVHLGRMQGWILADSQGGVGRGRGAGELP